MRSSALRHPLAVLRQIVGITQKELANLVGKSAATVQAIELGKLALSEELAAKIENQTGVSSDWLLDGDVTRPIENALGASYLKDDYELARAKNSKLPAAVDETSMEMCHVAGLLNGERLGHIFAAAMGAKPSKFHVLMFLAHQWLEEMEQKFGKPSDDYLEYRSRVTVSRKRADGIVAEIGSPVSPSASALHLSNFLRSYAEKHGQALADEIAAGHKERKNSTGKRKKALGSSKPPA
jgi:transcriptional regulator with XRE-family HTH domain